MKQGLHAMRIGVTILALVSFGTGAIATETHVVTKGDTLWSISKKHHASIDDIKRTNGVSSNKPLRIGITLTIPTGNGSQGKHKGLGSEGTLSQKAVSRFGPRTARQLAREAAAAETTGASLDSLVRTALSCRGSRYVRGGTGGRGFDCSGFTRYVYAKHGVKLPHQSGAQANCGNPVGRAELLPGDLVFFQTRGRRIGHVGIYVGRDKFVHASTTRTGVRVSSLDEAYYASRYRGARRIKQRG